MRSRFRRQNRSSPSRVRAFGMLAAAAGVALLSSTCGLSSKPNLVVITLDTTRADRIGAYGYEHGDTGAMDALAQRGTVFLKHLAPVPLTLPSHTSLFSGRYPPTHTVRDNGTYVVPKSEVMLAELLLEAGYQTFGFPASFPLDGRFGIDQGFEVYDDGFLEKDQGQRERNSIFFDERPASDVVRSAITHLDDRREGKPFFAFLHFFDPHQPMSPPAPYSFRFRTDPYDGEIAAVDAQLDRFFQYLEAEGLLDNTIVLVTADHGEGLGEHGELTHSILLHQATLHIPAILAGPGVPKAVRVDEWTSSTEILATLLELLQVDPPRLSPSIGRSLNPLLNNDGIRPSSMAPFSGYFETIGPRSSQGWSQLTAFMRNGWRFVFGPSQHLYNLDEDPAERFNQIANEPTVAKALDSELRQFLADNETQKPNSGAQQVDAETKRRLEALGYLQSSTVGELSDFLDIAGAEDPYERVIDVSLFSQAKAATAAGETLLARSLWQQVLARSPENVSAYQGMIMLYGQAGDIETAIAWAKRGLETIPDAFGLLEIAGQLLIESGRAEEGIEHLLVIPEGSNSVSVCTWLGWGYRQLGQLAEAEHWLRTGLTRAPKDRWLALYLANLLASQERFEEAETTYEALLSAEPYFALGPYNYALMLYNSGQTKRARTLVQRALTLHPTHEPSRVLLGELDAQG